MKADGQVLVLNFTYEYLHTINVRKAVRLIEQGKAECVEFVEGKRIKTVGDARPYPSVIRLLKQVNFKKRPVSFTRRRVFIRDTFTCQYCGDQGQKMTIDHVHPQSKGGRSTWENCVTACITCNKLKADIAPDASGVVTVKTFDNKTVRMRLKKPPVQPDFRHFLKCSASTARGKMNPQWAPYLYL